MERKGNGVFFQINATPVAVYEEFVTHARNDYGNCYWMALKGDMEKAKMYDTLTVQNEALWNAIDDLKVEIDSLKTQKEEKNALAETEAEPKQGLGSMIEE